MILDEQDLIGKLALAKANLEQTRLEIRARRSKEALSELSLSIKHKIARRAICAPIANGYSQERLHLSNDLAQDLIEFKVERGDECRSLVLSWGNRKYVVALCNRHLISAIETELEEDSLKIVSAVTRTMFVDRCIHALGFEAPREAA